MHIPQVRSRSHFPTSFLYISSKENIEARFDPDEAVIFVDGDLAVFWTKWTSFADGVKSYEGRIVFVLVKMKGTDAERVSGSIRAVQKRLIQTGRLLAMRIIWLQFRG
jgi:hypothetical protein